MATDQPIVIFDDEYEVRAIVTFRYATGNQKDAVIWRERLRSDLTKLSIFAFRKLGLSFEAEWEEPKKIGRRQREAA